MEGDDAVQRFRFPSVAKLLLSEVPDADLLERYVNRHDDDAFAQLVARYSRLVWGQCRNLLSNDADADDAFQASFITLAKSAKTIRVGAPLGPWLHGVAFRVCKNARRANGRRYQREQASAQPESSRPVADSTWESAFSTVAEEVQKLPEAQRAAFVLCCIEGRASTEVALMLGVKLGTLATRLTRAKQTLLHRLAKRGLGAAVLALGGVTGSVASAPAALIERTIALIPLGVVVPSSVLSLTYGVTGMMMLRFKLLAAGVLVATGLGLSVGGGWSSSVVAQVPGGRGGNTGPVDPTVDLRKSEELDRARERAQLLQKEITKLNGEVEVAKLRKDQAKDTANPAPRYKCVNNVNGLKGLEDKLAENSKLGWDFVGAVQLDGSVASNPPTLVFRERPTAAVARVELGGGTSLSAPKIEIDQRNNTVTATGPGELRRVLTPADVKAKLEAELKATVAKVANLTSELAQLRSETDLVPLWLGNHFTKADFGSWNADELVKVIKTCMAEDIKAKKFGEQFEFEVRRDGFLLVGSDTARAAVAEWVKKLKK